MNRIYVVCEGQTEETFINEILAPELQKQNIYITPRLIGKAKHRGGNVKYQRVIDDIKLLLQDKTAFCTTFFDFYGLDNDFPGKQQAIENGSNANDKLKIFIDEFASRLKIDLPSSYNRVIPYVQMYEFEGLLFSEPEVLANNINVDVASIAKISSAFETPENINNSKRTAPSKRIEQLCPNYDKVIQGNLTALDIGYQKIATKCPLFATWVEQIKKTVNELLCKIPPS